MESERLSISDAQKKILVEFYEEGMVSTKKELCELHAECAMAVRLSETQVKNWISNYKASKHIPGQPRKCTGNSVLIRKRSGYNVFVKEQLQGDDSTNKKQKFPRLGQLWNQLSVEEKLTYNTRATHLNSSSPPSLSDPQRCNKIITNMMKEVSELDNFKGTECLVICINNGLLYHGATKLAKYFLDHNPDVFAQFSSNVKDASFRHEKKEISQKMIQDIFNEKYGMLIGKPASLPYSRVKDIGLTFVGLPSYVLDIVGSNPKKPSFYGEAQRRKLWECQDEFSFVFNPPCLESSCSTSVQSSTTSNTTTQAALESSCPSNLPQTSTFITNSASKTALLRPSPPISTTSEASPCNPNTPPRTSFLATSTQPLATCTTSAIENNNQSPLTTLTQRSSSTQSATLTTVAALASLPTASAQSKTVSTSCISHPKVASENTSSQASILLPLPVQPGCSPSQNTLFLQLKEGTRFGLMDETNIVRGSGKVTARNTVHGRQLPRNSLVIEVDTLADNYRMKTPIPGPFDDDEPVEIGGYYAWPISKLTSPPE